MEFSDLEKIIKSRGLNTLAEFARELNTTPQAVSNWKSRNQVPHHIVVKLREQEIKYDLRQGKESFLENGGKNLDLIPCLNDNPDHISLLETLVRGAARSKLQCEKLDLVSES